MTEKMQQFIIELKACSKLKRYQELDGIINSNEVIKNKLLFIKQQQKELVSLSKTRVQKEMISKLMESNEILINEILDKPFVDEYLSLQIEINEFVRALSEIFNDQIN